MLHTTTTDPKAVTSLLCSVASNAAFKRPRSSQLISILSELQKAKLQLNVFHCSAAIKAFHYCDGWSDALDFVSRMNCWAVLSDDLVVAAAVHSFEKSNSSPNRWATAITFLKTRETWERGDPRWATAQINPAIGVCSNCDAWRAASDVLRRSSVMRARLDAISYNTASNSFAKIGMWLQSLALLKIRDLQSIQSDVIAFSSTINTLGQTAWAKGLHLLEEIISTSLRINETSCGAAAKVCAPKWQTATRLIEAVRSRALRIQAVLGHSILAACGVCSQWASTLRRAIQLHSDDIFDCKALGASIHAVSKARRWSLPLSLFQLYSRDCRHFDCVPHNALLAACGEGNAWATVVKLFGNMAADALVPDEVTWGTAVSSFENVARWRHSLHFLMERPTTSNICWNSAASSCEKSCHWQCVLSLIHCLGQHAGRPGSIGFNAAITACQTVRAWQWSLKFMIQLQHQQMATEVSYSEAAIAAAQASSWPLSLVLLYGASGGSWATSMGSAIEAGGIKQRLQLLTQLGTSSVDSLCRQWKPSQK